MGRRCLVSVGIVILASVGCTLRGQRVDELKRVCVRYVDGEGFLRGRTALFNTRGARRAIGIRYSHVGQCDPQSQGPTQRVTVCLARSSPCHHDRTTNIWADQIEQYFERYPGSYRGACSGDCAKHSDDCLTAARNFRGLTDWNAWMQHMQQLERQRRGVR